MGRFFEILNTPTAVLVVLVASVGLNALIYLGHRPPEGPAPSPAGRSSGPQRTVEPTEQTTAPSGPTRQQSSPRPATTPQGTVSAGQSATASASASPAP
jgi:hypothetical protein